MIHEQQENIFFILFHSRSFVNHFHAPYGLNHMFADFSSRTQKEIAQLQVNLVIIRSSMLEQLNNFIIENY
jgi:hypothetical protein